MAKIKRLKMKIIIGVVLASLLTFSIIKINKASKISGKDDKVTVEENIFKKPASDMVKKKLESMTLREKIAQMVVAKIGRAHV